MCNENCQLMKEICGWVIEEHIVDQIIICAIGVSI